MNMQITEASLRSDLEADYELFAASCLTIRDKAGHSGKLRFNRAQRFLHSRLEMQIEKTRLVRAIVLKGRKQGVSTYVGGRHYHKATHRFGARAYILTHMQEATDNLFEMIERFHEANNPLVKPQTGAANAKELNFKLLDSGYKVGTAGSKGVGRSDTIQLLHGSEVAFWPNAEAHSAGIIQAVTQEEGTEIILESTANGLGNYYADQWALAAAGKSEYEAIFIPWFWQEEYRRPVPDGFEMDKDERDQARAYGLDAEQIYWRRMKVVELGELWRFTQEYPSTPEEAFQSSGEGSFIKPVLVSAARRAHVEPSSFVPITIGVDPARGGRDSTAIIDRQGRRAGGHINETMNEPDSMRITARLVAILRNVKPRKIFIDATDGTGQSIYDRMVELGYEKYIEPVKFSHAAIQSDRYLNKRAEMWDEMREWLANPVGVQVPDDDNLQKELCAAVWGAGATRHNSNGKLVIEDKDHIRKRIGVSPDKADALALTFAAPIAAEIPDMGTVVPTRAADTRVGY